MLARDVLMVSGPDAASYLQGQCSQDVSGLGTGDSAEALLLSPQGKIDAYLRLTRVADDGFVLDTDAGLRVGGQGPPRALPAPDQGDHRSARLGGAWPSGDPTPAGR